MNKKILSFLGVLTVLATALPAAAFANVDRVPSEWQLTAPTSLDFVCGGSTYEHTLQTIDNSNLVAGEFSGTGSYDVNTDYTWDAHGMIVGNEVDLHILYTGTGAGSEYNLTGTINEDGSIEGDVDGNCETFSMPADAASQFTGNHGQYVKSQEDKQEAAHSRIGMPEKSKGHTRTE